MCELLKSLRAKYPEHGFERDAVTGVISFSFEDMNITDPFVSECSRFMVPNGYYGIETPDAVAMFYHNLPLEATYAQPPNG